MPPQHSSAFSIRRGCGIWQLRVQPAQLNKKLAAAWELSAAMGKDIGMTLGGTSSAHQPTDVLCQSNKAASASIPAKPAGCMIGAYEKLQNECGVLERSSRWSPDISAECSSSLAGRQHGRTEDATETAAEAAVATLQLRICCYWYPPERAHQV